MAPSQETGNRKSQKNKHPEMARLQPAALEGKHRKQREHEIKLFFHAERPGMQERITLCAGIKVAAFFRKVVIGVTQQGPLAGFGRGPQFHGKQDEIRRQAGDGRHGQHGRKDTADPPQIELPEAELARCAIFQNDGSDQETRNHEKHIHPEIAARQPFAIEMIDQHGDDGERAQSVDFRAVGEWSMH